jgi:hypothetical protein
VPYNAAWNRINSLKSAGRRRLRTPGRLAFEAGIAPHADIRIADDRTGADDAYRLLEAGTALLWRGDWVNARHLMQALTKRADRRFGAYAARRRRRRPKPLPAIARHRQAGGPAQSPARAARC